MRVGQKTQRTRIWARKGTRPRQVTDLRTGCVYLFGAICPERQTGAAVVMQRADTQGMQHHLDEISATVAPSAHAGLVLDQAAWHTTAKLKTPDNITFLPLPPRSPELNPAENVWACLGQRWLSNHIFADYDAVCDAWNRFSTKPGRIASIGSRQWARIGQD
jgi:transposase